MLGVLELLCSARDPGVESGALYLILLQAQELSANSLSFRVIG